MPWAPVSASHRQGAAPKSEFIAPLAVTSAYQTRSNLHAADIDFAPCRSHPASNNLLLSTHIKPSRITVERAKRQGLDRSNIADHPGVPVGPTRRISNHQKISPTDQDQAAAQLRHAWLSTRPDWTRVAVPVCASASAGKLPGPVVVQCFDCRPSSAQFLDAFGIGS